MKHIVRILCEFSNGSASEFDRSYSYGSGSGPASSQTRMAAGDVILTTKSLSLIRIVISQATFGPGSGIPQQLQEDIICNHQFGEGAFVPKLRGPAGLRAMSRIAFRRGEDNASPEENLRCIQNQLNKCGVSRMIIDLICSGRESVQADALRLGIMALSGGNSEVQKDIYSYLVGSDVESGKTPIGNIFVATIRDLIRSGIAEIKERKLESAALMTPATQQRPLDVSGSNANDKEIATSSSAGGNLIRDILRFLQLLCEGHFLGMQNYLRNQQVSKMHALSETTSKFAALPTANATGEANVNLVAECVQCLLALEKHIDPSMIDVATQMFVTLTEFSQGPCVANQAEICRPKLLRVISLLLSLRDIGSEFSPDQVVELKTQVLTTLISLLEGSNLDSASEIPDNMSQHLNVASLYKNRSDISARLRSPEKEFRQYGSEYVDKLERLGVLYHFLIHTLEDCVATRHNGMEIYYGDKSTLLIDDTSSQQQTGAPGAAQSSYPLAGSKTGTPPDAKHGRRKKRKKTEKIRRWDFEAQTGSIEIVREGVLERIYFCIPKLCSYLTEKTKDKFVKEVDRTNGPSGKIDGIVSETEFFMREMEHQEHLMGWKILALISHYWDSIKFFSFLLAVFMNVLIMATYTKVLSARLSGEIPIPGRSKPELELTGDYMYFWFELVMYFVSGIQLVVTVLLLLFYLVSFAPMTVVRHWKPSIPWNQRFDHLPRTPRFFTQWVVTLFMHDRYLWFLVFYLTVIIFAMFLSPLLYCLHLLEVIVRFPTLFNVLKAIYNNARTLLLTGFLGVIAVYIFSVPLFFFFSDAMVLPGHSDSLCNSAMSCFFATLHYGIRSNGFWEDLIDPDTRFARMIFNMFFFFICIVILMNIIFGVIIDTFDELRQTQREIENDIHNRCFICNFEAVKFDRKANEGISFQRHIKEDHTMWNYAFFLIYLYKKDHTEFTGIEQYIFEKLVQEDYSFFPVHRSLVLETSDRKHGLSDKTTADIAGGKNSERGQSHQEARSASAKSGSTNTTSGSKNT